GRADIVRAAWTGDGKANNRLDRSTGGDGWRRGPDPAIWLGGSEGVGLPEIPAILRKVTGYEDGEFVAPHMPPLRASNDGRVALYLDEKKVALIVPERLEGHFVQQPPGVPLLAENSITLDSKAFDGNPMANGGHTTLCDGSSQFPGFPEHNDRVNPIAC